MERLDKFISSRTTLSRTEIKKLAEKGKIAVNGAVVKNTALKITPDTDTVTVNGEPTDPRERVYILLNKPEGVVCATEDRRERTVIDLLPERLRRKDIFPAGRLDKDTTGMVLITNDGELSHRMLSPKSHIPKYYLVKLRDNFCENYAKTFSEGVVIDGGERCLPARVRGVKNAPDTAFLELFEGKFHQVKRMFASVENHVEKLSRIRMGGLDLPVNMGIGEHMELLHKDVEKLLTSKPFEAVYEHFVTDFSSYWINIM